MQLVTSEPGSSLSLTKEIRAGQYGMFCLRYLGDAAAGVTVTLAQLGSVVFNWNGQDIINCPVSVLSLLNNTHGGVANFSSAIGGAFEANIFLNCGLPWDSLNVYNIENTDKVFFKLDFPSMGDAAVVDSATVQIYSKPKIGIMNYLYSILYSPVNFTAGSETQSDSKPVNNVTNLIITNPTLISNIQLSKDGQLIADAPTAVVQAQNDYVHRLETSITTIVFEFGESKDIRENVGGNIRYQYVSTGAGVLLQYFGFLIFTPEKAQSSALLTNQKLGQQTIETPYVGDLNKNPVAKPGFIVFPSGRSYKLNYANVSVNPIDLKSVPSGYRWTSTPGGMMLVKA